MVLTELEDDRSRADELLAADEDLDELGFEVDFSEVLTEDDSDLARRSGSFTEAFLA